MKKNSRKKILLAAVMAGVLMLGAIVSIVLVLAAQRQNIASNINISYSADGVGAIVKANYGIVQNTGAVSMSEMKTEDRSESELVFNVTDSNKVGKLLPEGNIELTSKMGTEVVFEYIFQNTADTAFTIGLTISGEPANNFNIKETFYVSSSQLEPSEYGRISETNFAKQAVMNYDDILYVYTKVKVDNINRLAAYNKDYNWELNKIVTSEVIVTLNNGLDSDGASRITAIAGAATPILTTLPTAPIGMGFAGYYDAETGGTMYISANGVGVKEVSENITLYARYTESAVIDMAGGVVYGISPTASSVTNVVIPNEATEIAEAAFENNKTIETLTIGEDSIQTTAYSETSLLKKIGNNAFKDCINLKKIIFNARNCDNLTEKNGIFTSIGSNTDGVEVIFTDNCYDIPANLFYSNTNAETTPNIKTITIGKNVKNIASQAFFYLANLERVNYYAVNCNDMVVGNAGWILRYSGKDGFTAFIGNTVERIPNKLFHTTLLDEVIWEEGQIVKEFGNFAFYSNQITELEIPDTVETFGQCCFAYNRKLTALHFPKSIKNFGIQNTQYLDSLTSLTIDEENPYFYSKGNCIIKRANRELIAGCNVSAIPQDENILKIGYGAFDRCTLTTIEIPNTVIEIAVKAFQKAEIESIVLPNSVVKIDNYAFYDCTSLKTVVVSENLQSYGSGVFAGCTNIESMTIPAVFPVQGHDGTGGVAGFVYLFTDFLDPEANLTRNNVSQKLTTITVKGGTAIPDYAFYNLRDHLQKVIVEPGIKSVGKGAFSCCYKLTDLVIASTVESIGTGILYTDNNNNRILKNLEMPASLPVVGTASVPGLSYLFSKTGATVKKSDIPSTLTNIVINGGKKIDNYSFCNITTITTIKIKEGVEEVGIEAFNQSSGILSVELPASLKVIGEKAFRKLQNATSITIPDDSVLETIGDTAFSNCLLITELNLPATLKEIGRVSFTYCQSVTNYGNFHLSKVKEIDEQAFMMNKALLELTLPETVETVGNQAFNQCFNLKKVVFPKGLQSVYSNQIFTSCDKICNIEIPAALFATATSLVKTKLTDVTLNAGTTVPAGALQNLTALKNLTLASSITSYEGTKPLAGCNALEKLECHADIIPGGEWDSYGAFEFLFTDAPYCEDNTPDSLKTCIINGGTTIKDKMFLMTGKLETLIMSDTITTIGTDVFCDCTIKNIILSNNITTINLNGSIFNVVASDKVMSNGLNAKQYKNGYYIGSEENPYLMFIGLADINNPEFELNPNTKILANYCFVDIIYTGNSGSSNIYPYLTSLKIPNSVKIILNNIFETHRSDTSNPLTNIYYVGTEEEWNQIQGHENLEDEAWTIHYSERESISLVIDSAEDFNNISSSDKPYIESITISGVTEIPANAFEGCSYLTNVTIAEGVTSIGANAFKGCSGLIKLVIPEGVTSIGEGAFQNMTSLNTLVLPSTYDDELPGTGTANAPLLGCNNLVTLEGHINIMSSGVYEMYAALDGLYGDPYEVRIPETLSKIIVNAGTSLGSTQFGAATVDTIIICEGINEINMEAFHSCDATKIYLPNSIEVMRENSFYTEALKDIYYNGTMIEWNSIEGLEDAGFFSGLNIHCTDGTITIS